MNKFELREENEVRQKQIRTEILTLISEYINLEQLDYSKGKMEKLRLTEIQDIVMDYIKGQELYLSYMYDENNVKKRLDKALAELKE